MNEEYIYVKTNDVQKDMYEFVNQFGDEISSVTYVGNTIKLKNGVIYRFVYTTIGIRKYYTYTEIYNHHLKFQSKKLQQENKQLKEEKRLILKDISFWIRNSKVEQIEGDKVHQRYWMCFEDIVNKIFKKYNTENLSDEDLKYNHYLEKENEELIREIQQKEDIINKIKKYLRENEKEYGNLEENEKIILRIIDNKGE